MPAFAKVFVRLSPSRALLLLVVFCALCLSSCAAGQVEDTQTKPKNDAGPKITNIANLDVPRATLVQDIPALTDTGSVLTDNPELSTDASFADRRSIIVNTLDAGSFYVDASALVDIAPALPFDGGATTIIDVPRVDAGPPSDISSTPDRGPEVIPSDVSMPVPDTGMHDAGTIVDIRPPLAPELCNGRDDNGNGFVDEIFECSLGRRGDTCVTTCGANGYRLCDTNCRWNQVCQTYAEVCDDTIDNDCNGRVDCADLVCRPLARCEVVPPPPIDAGPSLIDAGRLDGCHELVIRLDLARLPACSSGRVIILYDSEGHPHESSPGLPLVFTLCGRLRGALMVSTRCGGDYLLNWPGFVRRPVREGGVASMVLDGNELADSEAVLCLDQFSPTPGIRPTVPLESFFYGRCP